VAATATNPPEPPSHHANGKSKTVATGHGEAVANTGNHKPTATPASATTDKAGIVRISQATAALQP
jgi:hypothetical protein